MAWFTHLSAIAALGCMTMSASPLGAKDTSIADEHAVLGLEDQYLASRLTGDPSLVDKAFAEDGVYIGENGDERPKAAYLAYILHDDHWASFATTERVIRLYRDAAVTHAILYVKVGADPMIVRLRTTAVYARQAKGWQIVSWQTTPLADVREPVKP